MNPQIVPTSRLARLSLRMQGDERLAELAGQGSEAAFEAIVHRYRPPLVRHCTRLLGDSDADEAVQDTLLRAHRALAGGTPVRSLGPWLHAIAHNSALAMLSGRRASAEYREGDVRIEEDADDLDRERLDALVGAVLALPERQRRALVMRELEGRSYDEIAARMGASNGAVRQLLSRARTSIRDRLGTLVPLDLLLRCTPYAGPSRAVALAGSGALAAKLSGAVLMSAAPVVAVAPAPGMTPAPSPPRHASPAHDQASAVRTLRAVTGVTVSAVARGEAPTAVRRHIDQERQRYENPVKTGHVVSGTPRPEGGVGERRPGQKEPTEHGQDPAAECAAQHVAEDPQHDQGQPGGDQGEQSEQAGHSPNVPAAPSKVVTQTG
jgi:RNA polymerase sigma factor (sigma-70 family)